MWMWLTSVASTSVYKSCKSSRVSMILIIHPTYSLLPVIDVYAASHSCKATIDLDCEQSLIFFKVDGVGHVSRKKRGRKPETEEK